ncbi:MAG: ABC transporter permease subunit [Clostridia bacterium]|nr:ABC transporter permease subunit [Clostridia bacterium]
MKRTDVKKSEALYRAVGGIDDRFLLAADDEKVWQRLAAKAEAKRSERRFVGYELKKLLGVRYLWVFLVIMLLLNSAVAWVTAGQSPRAGEPADMISAFINSYFEDPAPYDAHYEAMEAFAAEQDLLWIEAMQNRDLDFVPETLPDRYSTDGDFSDRELFAALHAAVSASRDYPEKIDGVLGSARANLAEFDAMGISPESFTYRYQLRVIKLYETAREEVSIGVEYTRGWGEYFAYDTVNIFLFLMILMLGTAVFARERQSGFLPILRATRHGRGRTAAAKLIAMLTVTAAFLLLFTASTFAVFGLRLGYSSPHNAIQALNAFTLSPYRVTVGQYFFIALGIRLLASLVFGAAVLALSAGLGNDVLIYLAGLGFGGLNLALSFLPAGGGTAPLRYLNPIAVAAVDPLFHRYRAAPLFGGVAGYLPLMAVLYFLLIVALSLAAARMYVRGMRVLRPAILDRVSAGVMTLLARLRALWQGRARRLRLSRRARRYSMSLTLAETFKLLISSRFLAVVLVLLALKAGYAARVYAPNSNYADHVYHEYMTELEGPLTEEKLDYLREERAAINGILARKEAMQAAYLAEEIGFEEYRAYLSDYNDAYTRDELFAAVEERAAYLQARQAQTGERGWFLYDSGWRTLYESEADLFLYAAILLLLTGIFASEYVSRSSSGGFAQILRATKNGRKRTFAAKLTAAAVVSTVLALLMVAVDITAVFAGYEMPAFGAPLWSMPLFESVGTGLTVGGYLFLFVLLRLLGVWLLAGLVCALSELLCKYIPTLGSSVMLTLLPALCAAFGLAAAEKLNYLNLLAGTPLWLMSARSSLFGSDFALLTVWILAAATAVTAALASARRVFVK